MEWKLTFADDDIALEVNPVALRKPEHRVEPRVRRSRVPVVPAVTLPVIDTFIYLFVLQRVSLNHHVIIFPIIINICEIFDLLNSGF
jgi:hypothetical protein